MTTKAYGSITWWGFSPAQNFLDVLSRSEVYYQEKSELNFLLIGACDGRHILKTVAALHLCKKKINFFVIESQLETIARQLLFVDLISEPLGEMGLQEKCELFMELYGNSLIRESTDDFLRAKCDQLIRNVTGDEQMLPLWNLDNLKFKDRDQLEAIFKLWRNKDPRVLDMPKLWDCRSRQYLGQRYDTRFNAFDWDYSMNLKEKASIINWHEYKRWRENGLAFQLRDESCYEISNKTLASGTVHFQNGERIPKRGYWGDIMISPYISYGIESSEKSLFKVNNKIHVKTSTDVTHFNVTSIIHQIHHGTVYKEKDDEGPILEEISDDENVTAASPFSNVTISFLSPSGVADLSKKSKFQHKFDLISFSNSMVHNLHPATAKLFADQGLLLVESTKFMLDLKDKHHVEYGKKISGMAAAANCKQLKIFQPMEDSYGVFQFNAP